MGRQLRLSRIKIDRTILLIAVVFLCFITLSTFRMISSGSLADDQISYWVKARMIAETPNFVWWNPTATFSFLLQAIYRIIGDAKNSFIALYSLTAALYLPAMYWSLRYFTPCRWTSALISIVSIVPHYTLGMTYWGFADFEFVRARILIMPFVVIWIRLYFEWQKTRKIALVFLLCGLTGVLNYESIYLGLIFCLLSSISILKQMKIPRTSHVIGMGIFVLLTVFYLNFNSLMIRFTGSNSAFFEISIYEHLRMIWHETLARMSDSDYALLRWNAARSAFWWALFPPSLSDLGLFTSEYLILIVSALWGMRLHLQRNIISFRQLALFAMSVIVIAYGYQMVRYLASLAWNWPPDIREEVRAFKFVLYPLYVWTAIAIADLLHSRRRALFSILCILLMASPMLIMRSIPEKFKATILDASKTYLDESKLPYLSKALQIDMPERTKDIEEINHTLRSLVSKNDLSHAYVLTTQHEIKLSGLSVLLSYQDKRGGFLKNYFESPAKRNDRLVWWYMAYSEISKALARNEPDAWITLADKYDAQFIVANYMANHSHIQLLYKGNALYLYQVI